MFADPFLVPIVPIAAEIARAVEARRFTRRLLAGQGARVGGGALPQAASARPQEGAHVR